MLSDAVAGYHHADDSATVVDSDEEGWYRFLASPHWPGWGVAGIEDDDWQLTSSPSDHNEYLGNAAGNKDAYGGFLIPGNGNTMTGFCSGCHEEFHKQDTTAAGASPWIRHPSDAVIPITGEYAGYTTYNPLAPVARPSLSGWTGPSSSVNQGGTVAEDLVMCLSCHRAHASPYYKMLRWDYKSWPGAGTNGCNVCHTSKN